MSHQVFIEGCRDRKPETATALARAIASRYGIDPAQIESRLAQGRFQVKANLNLASARMFVEYLEDAGALCSIVDAAGRTVLRSAALETATPEGSYPGGRDEVSMPELAESDVFALHTPPPPDYGSEYGSGLSAAAGAAGAEQTLGALDDSSEAAMSGIQLSAVDGSSDDPIRSHGASAVAASDDVAAFLPPDMLEEKALELDIDEPARRAPPAAESPLPSLRAESEPGLHESPPAESPLPAPAPAAPRQEAISPGAGPLPSRMLGRLSRDERLRFAVGVAGAIIVGFIAVHFFAAGREAERYGPVVSELKAEYAQAESAQAWSGLHDARSSAITALEDRRSTIVVMSCVLWLMVGGLLLFVWLRIIDWTRWHAHGLPHRQNPG